MKERENQRVMLTKKLLKDSLIMLLKKESIYKISIRELCENAGINRSTFYKYYGSQYDLLTELENEMLSFIDKSVADFNPANGEKQDVKLAATLSYLEENVELGRLLINNNVDVEFPQKLFLLPQIQLALRQMIGSSHDAAHTEYISIFIIHGNYNIIRNWINKDDREPAQELAGLVLNTTEKICGRYV